MECIAAFNSTHQAMEMESWVKEEAIKARLIPTPESISASCGLALKFQSGDLKAITELITQLKDPTIVIYEIFSEASGRKGYRELRMEGKVDE